MRFLGVAALALALAACGSNGSSEDDELATGSRSEISASQIAAALGPEDQSAIRDAGAEEALEDAFGDDAAPDNSVTSEEEEQ